MSRGELLKFITKDDVQVEEAPWGVHDWISREGLTDARHLMLVRVAMPAGKAHAFHRHPAMEEIIYVVSGKAEQWVDQEKSIYYVCVPDWTGGGLDELRVINSKYNLVKRYQVGRGASVVAVAQVEGKNSIGVSEIGNLYQTTWGVVKHDVGITNK